MFIIEMGQKVRERITGVTGVVVCRSEYLTGCNRYALQPEKLNKDGRPQDWISFDEDQLIDLGKNIKDKKKTEVKHNPRRGGPQPNDHLLQSRR
jgi:hypothetical protein